MKTVPSPQTSWLVFIAEAGLPSWQPSAPRKSRVGFWITSEFRHARLRWRRPSSSNFPSPSNDHGQLKLRIGVSPSCCITPSHRAYFHPPPEKLRQTWAALAPSKHKTHSVTSPQSAKPRKWPPDTCGIAFEKLILKAKHADPIPYCQLGKMDVVKASNKNKALTDFRSEPQWPVRTPTPPLRLGVCRGRRRYKRPDSHPIRGRVDRRPASDRYRPVAIDWRACVA